MIPKLSGTGTASVKVSDLNKVIDALNQLEATAVENREAIRAILTFLHPNPNHPDVSSDPRLAAFHALVMAWIEKYGRVEVPT